MDADQYLSTFRVGKGDHNLLDVICVLALEFHRQAFSIQATHLALILIICGKNDDSNHF